MIPLRLIPLLLPLYIYWQAIYIVATNTFTRTIDHLLAKSLESGVVTHSTRFVIEYSSSPLSPFF